MIVVIVIIGPMRRGSADAAGLRDSDEADEPVGDDRGGHLSLYIYIYIYMLYSSIHIYIYI